MRKNKVLCIFPNYYQFSRWHWLPTNFIFISSTLLSRGYDPIIIDDRFDRDRTIKMIDENINESLIILISAATGRQLFNARWFAQYIKSKYNIPICVGGPFPSALPEMTLTDKNIDYVIVGQGQYGACDLCDYLKEGLDINRIPNLYYRENNNIIKSKKPFEVININNMPELPYFNKQVIDIEKYINPDTHAINYTTSTGCVGRCSFCYWHEDYKYSIFENCRVIQDLRRLVEKFNVKNIVFDDPTFFVNAEKNISFLEDVKKEQLNLSWRANGRVDTLIKYTRDDWKKIKDSGCDVIHIGAESGSSRILKLIRKQINYKDCYQLIDFAKEAGVILRFHVLLGIPSETIDDLEQTGVLINKMIDYDPDFDYTIGFFTPYPGNDLSKLATSYGYIEPKSLDEYEELELIMWEYPDDERNLVRIRSPWKEEINVPWFEEDFQSKYFKRFREVIPEKNTIVTTGKRVRNLFDGTES